MTALRLSIYIEIWYSAKWKKKCSCVIKHNENGSTIYSMVSARYKYQQFGMPTCN
jgi:hypothetical protein